LSFAALPRCVSWNLCVNPPRPIAEFPEGMRYKSYLLGLLHRPCDRHFHHETVLAVFNNCRVANSVRQCNQREAITAQRDASNSSASLDAINSHPPSTPSISNIPFSVRRILGLGTASSSTSTPARGFLPSVGINRIARPAVACVNSSSTWADI